MTSVIQKIGKLAVQTFRRDQSGKSKINLEQLSSLVGSVTSEDLHLDPSLLQDTGPFNVSQP